MFKNRRLLIVTKHQKEKVIAPVFTEALQVRCEVAINFDTDALGTFAGEIERSGTPYETARQKCMLGMELYDADMAISSEGSFGVHPYLFFCHADEELVMFIDKKHGLEIAHGELSMRTNFSGQEVFTFEELVHFAHKSKFPSHGLIIRPEKNNQSDIRKGIRSWKILYESFHNCMSTYGRAYVETDMRANYNPMRMEVIKKASMKLLSKIESKCPQCLFPGYSVTKQISGLVCKLCGMPTRSVLAHEYQCKSCLFTDTVIFPNGKKEEDPMYCDICNP